MVQAFSYQLSKYIFHDHSGNKREVLRRVPLMQRCEKSLEYVQPPVPAPTLQPEVHQNTDHRHHPENF